MGVPPPAPPPPPATSPPPLPVSTSSGSGSGSAGLRPSARHPARHVFQACLPDGYSQIFRSYVFGPSGFWTMAPLRCAAKFGPFLSLDCAPIPSTLAQSKERKGSNFAIWQHVFQHHPAELQIVGPGTTHHHAPAPHPGPRNVPVRSHSMSHADTSRFYMQPGGEAKSANDIVSKNVSWPGA